jgi:hypothetical protein
MCITQVTNESVIKLVKSGIAETLVVSMVNSQPGKYALDVDHVLELKKAGVSDAVLAAMVSKPQGGAAPPAVEAKSGQTPAISQTPAKSNVEPKDLNKLVKEHYDGKTFVVVVPGLVAGEYQKQTVGPGQAGLVFYHFHSSIDPLPKTVRSGGLVATQISRLNQLDDRTFTELKSGLNVTKLVKGEQLRVSKFYMRSNYVELQLEPLDPSHLQDLDYNKASRTSRTSISDNQASTRVRVAGFGLRCLFFFEDEKIIQAGDFKAITDEIGKYFVPVAEGAKLKAQEDNIEIEIGMSEEEIIKRLGQPFRSIKVGSDKVLKYNDLTVTLKDGKVADVKIE